MSATMTPRQLAFWRALLAPFADHELSTVPARGSKRELTYLDKRALENRLDSVCGPHGWYPEYEATARGYKCRLYILVPLNDDAWVWMHKEDGAGFEEMGSYNKQTNEWEADVDNDEKSGYTNALRRAAQDAWGIGRYLYRKGIPTFLDPSAKPEAPSAGPADGGPPPRSAPESPPPASRPPANRPAPPPSSSGSGNGKTYDNFKLPRPGKAVFAWAKNIETHYETTVLAGMKTAAQDRGWTTMFAEWDESQVREVGIGVMQFVAGLPNYQGEFDAELARLSPAAPAPVAEGPPVLPADITKFVNTVKALLKCQIGREPDAAEIKPAIEKIAAEVPNSAGHRGETIATLKGLTDGVWLRNMQLFAEDQIGRSARAQAEAGDDIPF